MKIKLFNLFVRTFSVAMCSFAVFLPIIMSMNHHYVFKYEDFIITASGALVSGLGYGIYRLLQEINDVHKSEQNSKKRYNMKYEHTTIHIKERTTF